METIGTLNYGRISYVIQGRVLVRGFWKIWVSNVNFAVEEAALCVFFLGGGV